MKLSSKTSLQVKELTDFSGGLNVAQFPEYIAENELAVATNWEFNEESGDLQVVDGVTSLYDAEVTVNTLFYFPDLGKYIFSSGTTLYSTDLTTKTSLGSLSSTSTPKYCLWDDKLLVASGGALQAVSAAGVLSSVTGSPNCDFVFERAGRVVVSLSTSERITYSAVGDHTSWTNDPADDSTMQYLDIGYKDTGNIINIVPLSSDIIVFKDNGKVYRIQHEYPDWAVTEVSRNIYCLNRFTALQVGNEVYFIGLEGFKALSTVFSYGDIKLLEEPDRVNARIISNLSPGGARMWYIRPKKQVWIKPQADNNIYLWHYEKKAFTMRQTDVTDMLVYNSVVYIARGTEIFKLDSSVATDDGVAITSALKTKTYVAANSYLLKRVILNLSSYSSGTGRAFFNKMSFPVTYYNTSPKVYGNTDYVYNNTTKVWSQNLVTIACRGIARDSTIYFFLTTSSGRCGFRKLHVEYSEV